jgi:hypothetical protein
MKKIIIFSAFLSTFFAGHTLSYPVLPFCGTITYSNSNGSFVPGMIQPGTKVVEVMATLWVDSVWDTKDSFGAWVRHTNMTIVSVAKVDTTLFANDLAPQIDSLVSLDTSLADRHISDSTTGLMNNLKTGDTLRNALVLTGTSIYGKRILAIVRGECAWLKDSTQPFPLASALASFNLYLTTNNLPRGYRPPAGDLLLGPVFSYYLGDCGWGVKAWSDSNAWNIEHYVGGGDCPCGCTEHRYYLYRVTGDGFVTPIDSLFDSWLSIRKSKPFHFQKESLGSGKQVEIFDVTGRKIADGTALSHGIKFRTGLYFVRFKGSRDIRPVLYSGDSRR